MKVRVAYDTLVLVNDYRQRDQKSGIFRMTEEVVRELSKTDDVDLTLACICAEHSSLSGSLRFSDYIKNGLSEKNYRFTNLIGSRLGLKNVYDDFYKFQQSSEQFYQLQLPRYSVRSIYSRAGFKLVREAFNLFSSLDYYPLFEYESFDIFHSNYHKLPSKELTKGLPRVLTVHDLIPVLAPELVSPILTNYFEEVLSSIDLQNDWVICVSEYTRQQFCEYTGMALERTFVTPLAAASHFHPVENPAQTAEVRQRYGIPEGNYFLSLATHLAPHKNLDHLIRCFFKLLSEQPDLNINLVLAGSKRFKPGESINHPDFPQFNSRIVYTGYVADEDLSAIYSGATAFIFPSLYEGFGLPTLEAMRCGTPVITSNTTSLPEVVGTAGITIDPQDENALCQAMLNLLTDSNLVQELKQKGFERSQNFSWSKCAADTVEVYKKILSS